MPKYSKSRRFYVANGTYGFGYCIVDKGTEGDKSRYKKLFHSSSKEQILKVFETIEENHTDFPEPEKNWIPQNLKIKTRHYDYSYLIKSVEDLNEVCFKFCEEHYNSKYTEFIRWELPEEYNNIIDEDVINNFPDEVFRNKMREQNERNKKQQKDYEEHNKIIDLADKIISNKIISKGYLLFQEAEFLYNSFELTTFDN